MTQSFVLVLKVKGEIDVSKTDNCIFFVKGDWLQDREFKSESIWSLAYNIAKVLIPLHKIKITNNTNDEKELSLP